MYTLKDDGDSSPDRPKVSVVICPVLNLPGTYWRKLISSDEWTRFASIRHAQRANAVATRAWMRRFLLGNETDIAMDKVRIVTGRCGRHRSRDGRYYLSSSSTNAYVATACTRIETLGIDIEEERPLHNPESIAEAILNPREHQYWTRQGRKSSELLKLWCCKEAMLKADGVGFGGDVEARDVIPRPSLQDKLHCYPLQLITRTWCAVYCHEPVEVAVYLLGSGVLEHALMRRFGLSQVIKEVLRELADMRLNPATFRLV